MYLSANTDFHYPTIVLDHSSFVSATLSGSSLTVKFSTSQSYTTAKSSWPTSGQFVLVTTEGSDEGHFVYYLVSNLAFQDQSSSCTCAVTASDLNDIAEQYELQWGHLSGSTYSSGSGSGSGSSSSANSTAATNSSGFDNSLDAALGYYVWDESDFKTDLGDFAEGLSDFNWDDYDDQSEDADGAYDTDGDVDPDLTEDPDYYESYSKRTPSKSVGNLVARAATRPRSTAVVSQVKKDSGSAEKKKATEKKGLLGKVWDNVKKNVGALKDVKSYFDGTPHEYSANRTFNFPNATDPKYVAQTFWKNNSTGAYRKAYQLYQKTSGNKKLTAYCVDCGVSGTMKVSGKAAFHLTKGLQQGSIDLLGNLEAGVNLGVAAEYELSDKKSMRLLAAGIPGLSVPPFITIGPMITVDAEAGFNLSATGTLLVGGTLQIANAHAVLDLKDPSNNQKPSWQPSLKPNFEIKGEISADLYIALPVGIAVGVDIASSKFVAEVAVQSAPSLHVNATYSASASLENGSLETSSGNDAGTCKGISIGTNLQHSLYAQGRVKFFGKEKSSDKKKIIDDYKKDLGSKCLTLSGLSKRQLDNTTTYTNTTEDSDLDYSDYSDPFYPLQDYPDDEAQPFADLDYDLDGDSDGVDDLDEYDFPEQVSDFLNVTASNFTSPLDGTDDDGTNATTSYNFTILTDTSLSYTLVTTEDGNLGLQDASNETFDNALFAEYDEVVVGDSDGNTLFYYEKEMTTYNVSRLRLADADHIPLTTNIVGLVPMQFDDGATITDSNGDPSIPAAIHVAVDTAGDTFWPILCSYADGVTPSKVFLAADPEEGPTTLASAELVSVLTGGQISDCQVLGLVDGGAGI